MTYLTHFGQLVLVQVSVLRGARGYLNVSTAVSTALLSLCSLLEGNQHADSYPSTIDDRLLFARLCGTRSCTENSNRGNGSMPGSLLLPQLRHDWDGPRGGTWSALRPLFVQVP